MDLTARTDTIEVIADQSGVRADRRSGTAHVINKVSDLLCREVGEAIGSREEQVDFLRVWLLEQAYRYRTSISIANVESLDVVPDLVAFVCYTGFSAVVLAVSPTDSGRALEVVEGA